MDEAGGASGNGGWAFRRVTSVYIDVQYRIVYNTALLMGFLGAMIER
jgi:hypothetical protein